MAPVDFDTLLDWRPDAAPAPVDAGQPDWLIPAAGALCDLVRAWPVAPSPSARNTIEAVIAELDRMLAAQINLILHHPDFQAVEASWRGLRFLVGTAQDEPLIKFRILDITRRELSRTLRKYRGIAWDQSPIFIKLYEQEYGQLGGEPFGLLVGDFEFSHHAEDVQVLSDLAKIAAAAHAPFISAASPSIMQMTSWQELANPRDLTRIFNTPEYTAWRSMRTDEDSRYLGLCLPRFLGRLPYGARTDPLDNIAFEEAADAANADTYLWVNSAYAFAANVVRAFALYGWCTRIRGIDSGGVVEGLIAHSFASADGRTDLRCVTEVALSERREAELSRSGFMPLLHRKNTDYAVFISAQSLQQPAVYDDPTASANAVLAARLPYLFATCRFAHYLKCMVRDKVGSNMSREQIENWLDTWLLDYVDGSPDSSSDEWKAAHPLREARVVLETNDSAPGHYEARFFLLPHYQLEGMNIALRLVSRLPAQ
jgi:type VI secretion system protein ImpC